VTDYPIRILAVLGAAGVGALGTGGLLRILARLTFTRQKLPLWLLRVLRLLGAVALGSVAALWVFGGGQGGFGGLGGSGIGSGSGSDSGSVGLVPQDTAKDNVNKPGPPPVVPSESLQIEVLSHEAAKRLSASNPQLDPDRRYRADIGNGPAFFNLDELKGVLLKRQTEEPPLRQVILVLYKDTPERRTPAVADLKRWIEEDLPSGRKGEKTLVNIDARGQNAPAQ
jgi:hypothetical protein